MLENQYHGGEYQRGKLAESSRRHYRLAKRLSASALATLYTFLAARIAVPFVFYDPFDVPTGALPGSNYDATGANPQGQVIVVARMAAWSQTTEICRSNVDLELEEVA